MRPPQCPTHPDEGPSAIRLWSPSTEGRTSQHSSGQRMSNPHAHQSDDLGSPRRSHSKLRTTRKFEACARPRPNRSLLHIWGKTPEHCGKRPGLLTNSSEALHFLSPSLHCFTYSLWPTSAQGCDIRWRNMTRPPRRRRGQVIDRTSWNLSVPNLESGSISRSSHRLDPGSILVNGFLLSKARRPNASGERDTSRSTMPRDHISFGFDRSSSWETRILWALARYAQIGEL